jgi:hypothetical protein
VKLANQVYAAAGSPLAAPPNRAAVDFPRKLMDLLPCKAISSVPKLTNRTPIAFVIDTFLVRAADYAVGHRDG